MFYKRTYTYKAKRYKNKSVIQERTLARFILRRNRLERYSEERKRGEKTNARYRTKDSVLA